jgi:hypothetical protein
LRIVRPFQGECRWGVAVKRAAAELLEIRANGGPSFHGAVESRLCETRNETRARRSPQPAG